MITSWQTQRGFLIWTCLFLAAIFEASSCFQLPLHSLSTPVSSSTSVLATASVDRTTTKRKNRTWSEQYERLTQYRKFHGNCRVPALYEEDRPLGRWVRYQRAHQDSLSAENYALLDELGFDWSWWKDRNEKVWQEGLERYAKKSVDPKARSIWAGTQRRAKKCGFLSDHREKQLNAIGFDWIAKNHRGETAVRRWEAQYTKLVQYKEVFGHCRVPQKYIEDPSLGHWVYYQRYSFRINRLSLNRKNKLDDIGFVWEKKS